MKEIQLTQGMVALVDDDMYEELSQYKWYTHRPKKHLYYAQRNAPTINSKRGTIRMHHIVAGFPLNGLMTDHRDGNGLNNQRENLRFVTSRQNSQNRQTVTKTSCYVGVYWHKQGKKWAVYIRENGAKKYVGLFTNELQAFLAYQQAVESLGQTVIDTPKQGIPNNQNFHS